MSEDRLAYFLVVAESVISREDEISVDLDLVGAFATQKEATTEARRHWRRGFVAPVRIQIFRAEFVEEVAPEAPRAV